MQLFAHSVVPSSPVPYLHLGYLSAGQGWTTHTPVSTQSIQWPLFFAILAIFIGIGTIVSFVRRSSVMLLIGIVLFAGGTFYVIVSRDDDNQHRATQSAVTDKVPRRAMNNNGDAQ